MQGQARRKSFPENVNLLAVLNGNLTFRICNDMELGHNVVCTDICMFLVICLACALYVVATTTRRRSAAESESHLTTTDYRSERERSRGVENNLRLRGEG
jgi:hypothetical protein